MSDELNEKEKVIMAEYQERYKKMELSTEPVDPKKAEEFADALYTKILNREKPIATIVCGSPRAIWYATVLFEYVQLNEADLGEKKIAKIVEAVKKEGTVTKKICDMIEKNVCWEHFEQDIKNYIWPYIDGQFSAKFFAENDFAKDVKKKEFDWTLYDVYKDVVNFGPIYPLEKFCLVSDRPLEIHVNAAGVLHNDGGPAIAYRDGLKIWSLNGVRVTQEIAETPMEKMNGQIILKYDNAEVRREIVRKLGAEKVVKDCNATVTDKSEDGMYELLSMKIGSDMPKFLKMRNPSIGVYHIEGVSNECNTVMEALNFRKPDDMKKIPVAEDGEDWFIQGDVFVWPRTAKKLKPKPSKLS